MRQPSAIYGHIFLGKNLDRGFFIFFFVSCRQVSGNFATRMENEFIVNGSKMKKNPKNRSENACNHGRVGFLFSLDDDGNAERSDRIKKTEEFLNSPNVLHHETFARLSFCIHFFCLVEKFSSVFFPFDLIESNSWLS